MLLPSRYPNRERQLDTMVEAGVSLAPPEVFSVARQVLPHPIETALWRVYDYATSVKGYELEPDIFINFRAFLDATKVSGAEDGGPLDPYDHKMLTIDIISAMAGMEHIAAISCRLGDAPWGPDDFEAKLVGYMTDPFMVTLECTNATAWYETFEWIAPHTDEYDEGEENTLEGLSFKIDKGTDRFELRLDSEYILPPIWM